jgi:uncharacterized membrane protein
MREEREMSDQQFVVFAGTYENVDDAKADFDVIKEMHKEAWLGPYEGALFVKEEGGKVKILDRDSSIRAAGAGAGAVVGGVIGLIFPPTILAGAVVGGAAGGLLGHFFGTIKRKDIAELGEMLDEGMAGIFMIGVATPELGAQKLMKRAAKVLKKQVDADADDLKKAIDEAAKM